MNLFKTNIMLLFIVVTIISCESEKDIDISGIWVYKTINRDSIIEPLKSFYPTSYPRLNNFHDKVYIDSEKIDHPLMLLKDGFSIEGKFTYYKIEGNKIILQRDSLIYEYDIQMKENDLCFDNGKFCLSKDSYEPHKIDSTIFKFALQQESGPSYLFWMNHNYKSKENICTIRYDNWSSENAIDTIALSLEEQLYIIKMLERVPENQLDRIYNNGLSDCMEISIDFYTASGHWKGIETCGLRLENPFEVRVLASNMFMMLHKHLRKEE